MVNAVPMIYRILSQFIFSEVEGVINGGAASCALVSGLVFVADGVLISAALTRVA